MLADFNVFCNFERVHPTAPIKSFTVEFVDNGGTCNITIK